MVRSDAHRRVTSPSDNHEPTGEVAADMTDSHRPGQTVVEVSVYSARQCKHRLASNMSLRPVAWNADMVGNRGVCSLACRLEHVELTV